MKRGSGITGATGGSVAEQVREELEQRVRPGKREELERFFQVRPGGYGEGDRFLGVSVPDQRAVAGKFWQSLPIRESRRLLESPIHEHRLTAVLILIRQFEAKRRSGPNEEVPTREEIATLAIAEVDRFNNWDIVDTVAPRITGPWFIDHDRTALGVWAESGSLWRERMAVMSTFAFIRAGEYQPTIELTYGFLTHPHDLIHKATGWMLREIGNREPAELTMFLGNYAGKMPRTMLRYAIEKLPADERARWRGKRAT